MTMKKAARTGFMIMAASGCLACAGCDGGKLANAAAGIAGGLVIVVIILLVVCWIGDGSDGDDDFFDKGDRP